MTTEPPEAILVRRQCDVHCTWGYWLLDVPSPEGIPDLAATYAFGTEEVNMEEGLLTCRSELEDLLSRTCTSISRSLYTPG